MFSAIKDSRILEFLLLLPLFFGGLGCARPDYVPTQSEPGVLDLSSWDPERDGMASLDGDWAFYPRTFLPPDTILNADARPKYFLQVPGTWNHLQEKDNVELAEVRDGCLFGTYHLRVRLPESESVLAARIQSALSAYDLWVGDQLVASVGKPGESESTTIPLYTPRSGLFSAAENPLSITIHIANFHHRDGGLYRSVRLGTPQQLISHERRSSMTDMFVLASIAVMAGYHLIHFGYRRQEVTSLYFALGCLALMIWHSSNSEHLLGDFFPGLDGKVGLKIDYCSFFASVSFFSLFTRAMFPRYYPKVLIWLVLSTSAVMIVGALTSSMYRASQLIPIFQLLTLVYALVTIACLIRACWCRTQLAGYILLGLFVFIATVVNDFLYSNGLVQTSWLSPFGLVFLVVATSMTISVRFKMSFSHVTHLKQTFERFVPKRFLLRITDEDLSEIQLGNAHGETLVVLFSDIRGFTSISEKLSPEDLLEYLNLYFLEMANVVKNNNGFIDKFIGDGIMALFDEIDDSETADSCTRALQCAIEMHRAIPALNQRLEANGWPPIRIGIGVHYGPVVMGTVGAEFRMDSTVLGDTVNTSARLEGLAKEHNAPVVLSHTLLSNLPSGHSFQAQEIGTVPIRGKQQPLQVFALQFEASPE